jgi:exopolysaccharide biosynthesis WecB/TagA/CpsF family protein
MLDEQNAADVAAPSFLPPSPPRRSVVGAQISVTDYDGAVACILSAARRKVPYLVTALAVHGVVETRTRPELRTAIEDFDIVTPDGQPVRMALNWFHGASLADRVYGPTLTLRLCERAAAEGIPVYFYGSTPEVVAALARSLAARFPGLEVAGAEPSIFRPLTAAESEALGERIRASGAGIVFVGLGCPRQEIFAWENRDVIGRPMVCVGAAFDFHAGSKRQAPAWMQEHALEWLFRLSQEPRRLVRRYAVTNTVFVWALLRQWARHESVKRVRP